MLTQSLPPLFLLPAWSAHRLRLLAIVQQQRATHHHSEAIPIHERRDIHNGPAPAEAMRGTTQTNGTFHGHETELEAPPPATSIPLDGEQAGEHIRAGRLVAERGSRHGPLRRVGTEHGNPRLWCPLGPLPDSLFLRRVRTRSSAETSRASRAKAGHFRVTRIILKAPPKRRPPRVRIISPTNSSEGLRPRVQVKRIRTTKPGGVHYLGVRRGKETAPANFTEVVRPRSLQTAVRRNAPSHPQGNLSTKLPNKQKRQEKIRAHVEEYDLRLLRAIKRLGGGQVKQLMLEASRKSGVGFLEENRLKNMEPSNLSLQDKLRLMGGAPVESIQTQKPQPITESISTQGEDSERVPEKVPLTSTESARPAQPVSEINSDTQEDTPKPVPMKPAEPAKPAPEWKFSSRPDSKSSNLFSEIFPEEKSTQGQRTKEKKKLDKLPVFSWMEDFKEQETSNENRFQTKSLSTVTRTQTSIRDVASQSVLVLNCALHSLEESDFFRLSPKGEHIEGWTSGIVKVIPGRDNRTLEPLDHYFILFSNEYTARAYLDNIFRLHRLAETSTRDQMSLGNIALPPGFLKDGEDVQAIIKNFSLAPAHTKLSMRFIEKPYKPGMLRLLSDGGQAAIASNKSKAENMVLFYTDYGRVSSMDILEAIYDDGRERNLMWKLVTRAGEREIIALEDSKPSELGNAHEVSKMRQPKRFVISFTDRHEARRFVREWHRRPFPSSRKTIKPQNSEEPAPTINAEILW